MIKKIIIKEKNKCLQENFPLELEKMTVITGENNCGKSSFGEQLDSGKYEALDGEGNEIEKDKIKVIYVSAENQLPEKDELKGGATSTSFVKNLADLFSTLGIDFELSNKDEVKNTIDKLLEKTNENLEKTTGSKEHKLDIKLKKDLNKLEIIKSMIEKVLVDEYCGVGEDGESKIEKRDLNLLGSGTKRIIIVSVLKAYLDLLRESDIHTEDNVLIVVDEPELHLHPKLKRKFNSILENISNIDGDMHQVLIMTHDPYFVFSNMDGNGKKICSFIKEGGNIKEGDKEVIDGIEDELLFVYLYSKLSKKLIAESKNVSREMDSEEIEGVKERNYIPSVGRNDDPKNLRYIRDQIHHSGDNENTVGLVEEIPTESKNYYLESELAESIKRMSSILGRE